MLVSLTRDGWDLFRNAVLEAEPDAAGVFAPLTDAERKELVRLLEKAVAGEDGDHARRR